MPAESAPSGEHIKKLDQKACWPSEAVALSEVCDPEGLANNPDDGDGISKISLAHLNLTLGILWVCANRTTG